MELIWIDDFIALDRTQNFTKAARQRHTTQPAFSRRIKTMENWFGTPLFHRDTRPVALTNAGIECKKRIYRLREDIMDMRRITHLATSSMPDGATVICTTNTIAIGYLSQWIRENSITNYRLVVSSVSHAIDMVNQNLCDYALIPHFKGDSLPPHSNTLTMDRLVFMRPQDQSISVHDNVIDANIVAYAPKTAYGQAINAMMQKKNLSFKYTPLCESASAEALLAQIKNGLGSGWVVESLLNVEDKKMIDNGFFHVPFDIICIHTRMS